MRCRDQLHDVARFSSRLPPNVIKSRDGRTFQFAFTAKRYQIDDVDSENNVVPNLFPAAKYKDSTLKICAKTENIVDRIQNLKRHPVNKRFF